MNNPDTNLLNEDKDTQQETTVSNEPENQVAEPTQTGEDTGLTLDTIAGLDDENLEGSFEDFLDKHQQQVNPEQTKQPESNATEQITEATQTDVKDVQEALNMSDSEFRQFLTSAFRANNSEVQVTDPNDIRRLMQMGLNYQKKMAEIKPQKRILKSLEQNGLMDEGKLNYAIELLQGKPEAIAQLLKEHSVDAYELPDLEETNYQPNNYIPSQTKVDFEEKTRDLSKSDYGRKVIDFLNDLPESDFVEVYNNINYLNNLERHASTGLLQDAINLLETERALGKVPENVSTLDAYAYVAQHLEKENPTKYSGLQETRKVIGTNLGQSSNTVNQQNSAKFKAGIPTNNAQTSTQQPTGLTLDDIAKLTDEQLANSSSWEDFLVKNKVRLKD